MPKEPFAILKPGDVAAAATFHGHYWLAHEPGASEGTGVHVDANKGRSQRWTRGEEF